MPIIKSRQDQYNPENERLKYEYRKHLLRIKRADEKTVKTLVSEIDSLGGERKFVNPMRLV